VFTINVCHSIFGPIPAPRYHPEGMYEFKIDLNGDAIEDLTYRFTFNERDKNGNQSYIVRQLKGADARNPKAAGTVVAQGTTGETVDTPTGLRVGPARRATRSGSSPMCCTRLDIHSRKASPSIFLDGIPVTKEPVCWPHGAFHRTGGSG
jgi:hypothetical protein